ncbi:MAG: zinc-binding dehydrogenase [Planctomycetales bacterium]|nr:zinc-binding dehydrogenase [Planctomycetales bacterium]
MRAVVIRKHGGPEVLAIEERPQPVPGPGEVLVRMEAAALNHLDLWVRRGIPGVKYPLPMVPGCDLAGEVVALGPGATGVKVGEKIVTAPGLSCGRCAHCHGGRDHLCRHYGILGETRDGSCQEFVAIPAANALPRPANLDAPQAASVPLVFLTAWHMLVARAGVRPGDDVLVHAAAGGVGVAAVQVAKLHGARVIATAGSDPKGAKVRALGADEVVNYRAADFVTEVRRLTAKKGVEIVVDTVGADTVAKSVSVLAAGGRLVTCGVTSGADVALDFRRVFFRGLSILGSTMGSRGEVAEVLAHVAAGRLRPVVDRVLPLAQVAEAHRVLEAREAVGKVVLVP